jgi:hypothetical protein
MCLVIGPVWSSNCHNPERISQLLHDSELSLLNTQQMSGLSLRLVVSALFLGTILVLVPLFVQIT